MGQMGVGEVAPERKTRIGVIGAGSWGTTLANLLAEKDYAVSLWVREEEVYRGILTSRENKVFLPGVTLDRRLRPVRRVEEAVLGMEMLVLAVPSHVFRGVLERVRPHLEREVLLVTATKGIENGSLMVMSQIVEDVLPRTYGSRLTCLSGPSFATEVSQRRPTAVTASCRDLTEAKRVQQVFATEFLRVYAGDDLIGTELGGALKNVIAVAAGVSDGVGFGDNARAALVTRGLAEIARLGVLMGAKPLTFAGLTGMGDLVLTCTSDLSRNRRVGIAIGRGKSVEEVTGSMQMVAEGVRTTRSTFELSRKFGIDMPITEEVYRILYERKDPRQAVRDLMGRELRVESELVVQGPWTT